MNDVEGFGVLLLGLFCIVFIIIGDIIASIVCAVHYFSYNETDYLIPFIICTSIIGILLVACISLSIWDICRNKNKDKDTIIN